MNLKPVQVRLPKSVYAVLASYANQHHLTLGGAARALITDQIMGRAHGLPEYQAPGDLGAFVYVLKVGGLYKIGKAKDVNNRIRNLHLAEDHEVVFSVFSNKPLELEKALHNKFKHLRVKREWFKLTDAELSEIAAYLDRQEKEHD